MGFRDDSSHVEPCPLAPEDLLAIGLGCNQGDPHRQLQTALLELEELLGTLWLAPFYRSAALSDIPQDDYLNTVAVARLPTGPRDQLARQLMMRLKELEGRAGRELRGPRDAPRPLDLDILLWGQEVFALPTLGTRQEAASRGTPGSVWPGAIEIPHSRLRHRRFVLAPLGDLLPCLPLPPDGTSAQRALAALGEAQRVERWEIPPGAKTEDP